MAQRELRRQCRGVGIPGWRGDGFRNFSCTWILSILRFEVV